MKKPEERTLLASVALSAPGPLVVGLGLLLGRSSTQLADFIRRTAELVAIVVSWVLFRRMGGGEADAPKKAGPETACDRRTVPLSHEALANLWVGGAMGLGGIAMLFTALFPGGTEKGNVIPGLVIALLGVATNTWFWLRYRRLDKAAPNGILAAQSKLYRTKALVDACVSAALTAVAAAPASALARHMDAAGTVAVAAYLLASGAALVVRRR